MRKLAVKEWMTLDGVIDADSMDIWWNPYHSDERGKIIQEGLMACDTYLLGRTTHEMLAPYWSAMTHNEMGIADKLNSVRKYVVSSSLAKADWNNSTLIKDHVVEAITQLKQQPGQDILIDGSATLVQSLMDTHLIDEYRFIVSPVIMGRGKRFFKDGQPTSRLKLVKSESLPLGVLAQTYQAGRT